MTSSQVLVRSDAARAENAPDQRGTASSDQWQEFIDLVHRALKKLDDQFALDEIPTLYRLPVVQQWIAASSQEFLVRGKAVQLYLRQAVEMVIAEYAESPAPHLQRIALFARGHYLQGKTVVAVAKELGISRSLGVHEADPRSLRAIARAFHWLTVTKAKSNTTEPRDPVTTS